MSESARPGSKDTAASPAETVRSLADLLGFIDGRLLWRRWLVAVLALYLAFVAGDWLEGLLRGFEPLWKYSFTVHAIAAVAAGLFVVILLRFTRSATIAIAAAAVATSLLTQPVAHLMLNTGSARGPGLFEPLSLLGHFTWLLFLLAGLDFMLRRFRPVWFALLLGAAVASLLQTPILAGSALARRGPGAFGLDSWVVANSVGVVLLPWALAAAYALLWTLLLEKSQARGWGKARLSKGFYLIALGTTAGAPLLVTAKYLWDLELDLELDTILPLGIVVVGAIASAAILLTLVYRMWSSLQDGETRISPGRAVGFLFIPVFNLYWAFRVLPGFASAYNRFAKRHAMGVPRLSMGLFVAYILFALTGAAGKLAFFTAPVTYLLGLAMTARICDAVNALPLVPQER